jgi:ABC-type molybdate transport system permease subunit
MIVIEKLMTRDRIAGSLKKTLRVFLTLLPIVIGMLLLTSLAMRLIAGQITEALFGRGVLVDAVVGALIGSVALGHPSASYIIGGELRAAGVELTAVTALLVTWVTVGIAYLPAESLLLGRRFAILRNAIAFGSALAIAWLVPLTLRILS